MPESYRPPLRKDDKEARTSSQSVSSNTAVSDLRVQHLLDQKDGALHTVRPQQTLHEAVELLRVHRIGALIVTDANGALVGILSERDIVRKLADAPGKTLPHKVEDVMTRAVETCTADESLVTVLKRMTNGRFRHMPVVEGGTLSGLVTIGDVVHFRLTQLEEEALQIKQLIVG
ncbi:CBS domain-containing protein [Rhodalgimonas zhirmunskyi]|uniref:CBS domain-containing protein n=1 Tax=Rhodalgimonas zhirmunskyi TaxID=2964767 RepID=A0AAJ1UCE9_9RHOB|nr:CBS domain-containing protein [Rhodoalgimonas zhirmunskyi]MDQ2093357.1 CBS domain-containing protein [Rhodoalgimonas zhirmunskyi]